MKYILLFVASFLMATGINAQTVAGDFKITGGSSPGDWEYSSNILTIKTGTPLIIEMATAGTATTADRIVVATGITANITLKDVKIDRSAGTGDNDANCPFFLTGTAKANLTLLGSNVLKAGQGKSGLHVPHVGASPAELIITAASTGSLTAVGGNNDAVSLAGAGIGGHHGSNGGMSGIITILGGKITATAGTGGDGFACDIGAAAEWTPGGDITINGGVIQANLIGSAQNTYSLTMNGNAIVYTGNHGIDAILNITNGILFNNSIGNVYGDVLTDYDFNIPSGYTLNIPTGKSITIQSGKSLTNEGTVIVNGTLTSDGSITNDGTVVVNDGSTVTVNGAAVSGANKILGANVNQPVLVSRTHESITMGANSTTLKATTGQGAEFGISIVNNVATATWGNMTGIFTESSSGVALLPNTSYYFFVRSAANENFNYGTASNSIVFRTLPLLTGSVYISGDIIYGSQLTASPNNLPGSAVAVYYKWHREGVIESISTEATYTLVAADVGKKIKVVITSQNPNFGGSLEDEVGPIQPRPITFTGTVSASKVYDGNDIFTDTHIIINNITSFANILPADEGAGKVELSKTGASGKFGPAPGTGVLSNVSGFTLTGERAHNYTLSAQPSPVPAEILSLPEAIDDRVSVFACHSKTVNVLANDYNVGGGNLTIDRNGKRGDAQVSGTDVIYNHNAAGCATHGGKHDTVKYSICTANGCDTAKLIVDILRLPSIKLMDSCSRSPYLTIDYQYPNAQHQWYRSPTGGDGTWTEMDSSLRLKVPVTEDAWYKVEITHAGETVVDKVHFVVHRKSKLQGNTFWYISSIIR